MSQIKDYTQVTTPADTDELVIQQGGTTLKATRAQIVAGVDAALTTTNTAITNAAAAGNNGGLYATVPDLATRITWLETAINPLSYGAVADGTSNTAASVGYATNAAVQAAFPLTDALHDASGTLSDIGTTTEIDYLALQEAIQQAKANFAAVVLPPSKNFYIGDGSIWCGHASDPTAALRGLHGNHSKITSTGGAVVMDWTGARWPRIEAVEVVGTASNGFEVGWLFSRVDAATPQGVGHAWCQRMDTSGHGKIGVYNICGETFRFHNCWWNVDGTTAKYPYAQTYTNVESVSSHFATVVDAATNATTNTFNTFVGVNFVLDSATPAAGAKALYLGSCQEMYFDHCLFNRDDVGTLVLIDEETGTQQPGAIAFRDGAWHGAVPAARPDVAIEIGSGSTVNGLYVENMDPSGSFELVEVKALGTNVVLRDVDLHVNEIELGTGSGHMIIGASRIRTRDFNATINYDLRATSGGTIECIIFTDSSATINTPTTRRGFIYFTDIGYKMDMSYPLPTAAVGAALGTGGTASVSDMVNNTARLTIGTGTSAGSGIITTVTYGFTIPTVQLNGSGIQNNPRVMITPQNAAAIAQQASGGLGVTSSTASGFNVYTNGGLTDSQTLLIDFHIVF